MPSELPIGLFLSVQPRREQTLRTSIDYPFTHLLVLQMTPTNVKLLVLLVILAEEQYIQIFGKHSIQVRAITVHFGNGEC